jgi:hypothetical protein
MDRLADTDYTDAEMIFRSAVDRRSANSHSSTTESELRPRSRFDLIHGALLHNRAARRQRAEMA